MPEMLNLLAPLLLGSINGENLPKRVRKKEATLIVAGKKQIAPKGWCCKPGLLLRQSWDAYVSLINGRSDYASI
jgi:hypothetical protein